MIFHEHFLMLKMLHSVLSELFKAFEKKEKGQKFSLKFKFKMKQFCQSKIRS